MLDIELLLNIAKKASLEAGNRILEVYQSADFGIETKGDASPLTLADKKGHDAIIDFLDETGIPVLSEEGKEIPFETRSKWESYWLIDPLDGTKEFIKRNGEFTVNIALIQKGKPIMGVVYAPALDILYWGSLQNGAFKQEKNGEVITLPQYQSEKIETIVASRSHLSEETANFIAQYPDAKTISMGSSLKFMLVAEGTAQIYPRFAPTMEWDTAAAQAVVEAAGGQVLCYPANTPLVYNRPDMLNGWFLVKGVGI